VILLVEDDIISRASFAATLQIYGHEVLGTGDAFDAIKELEKNSSIELVITDMVLPGLHGLDLVTNIRARWPKVSIIVISGYLSQSGGTAILAGKAAFLSKPITTAALVGTVNSVLPPPQHS
jgi:DNA-binding NtrC family response regulator